MKTSARLVIIAILGVVLVAPPAYPQNARDQMLAGLVTDTLNLKNSVKQLQDSNDRQNAEMTKLMQEMLTRFNAIDASVQRLQESLNVSLTGRKTSDEKSSRDLQETRASVEALRKTVDEGMIALQNQVRGLTSQLNELKTVEKDLPSAAQIFNQAWGELNQSFYDLAVADFREFLNNYPNDLRAAAAAFYIGEALMAQEKLDEATTQFDHVLSAYPDSDKKCTALYRKGQILVKQKQIPQARTALDSVVKTCPNTQEATNAAADLKTLPRR